MFIDIKRFLMFDKGIKLILSSLLIFVSTLLSLYAANPDDVVGLWKTANGKGLIEISKSKDGTYQGKVVGGEARKDANGNPIKTDVNNPDPSKRNRPTIGIVIMTNFTFDGDDQWTDGLIYNPEDGKEYKCKMWLDDPKTLNIRGYIGFSLLGRTEKWTKIK
jgi:uncharacterized protein (DUF2147 family)